jgi:cystathionine gamma-lyase
MATVLELLDSGAHTIASDDLYGGTFRLFEGVRRRTANLDFTFVDLTDLSHLKGAIKQNTQMIWVETPSNPLLKLVDLEGIARFAAENQLLSVCDNTFAGPWIWERVAKQLRKAGTVLLSTMTRYSLSTEAISRATRSV